MNQAHVIFTMSREAKKVDISLRKRKKNQGMNWCWSGTRKVIYWLADHKCAWCGKGKEDGVKLSLDHIIPNAYGGSNHRSNLVTCCVSCNAKRGDKLIPEYIEYLRTETDATDTEVADALTRIFKAYTDHTTAAWNAARKDAIASGYLVKTKKGYK